VSTPNVQRAESSVFPAAKVERTDRTERSKFFLEAVARALGAEVIEEPLPLRFNLCNRRARPAVPPSGWQFELAPLGIGRMALPIGTMDASTRQGP
jgi:hypothetical protein